MPWSYNHLWKKLIDANIKRSQLIELAGLRAQTIANMGKNKPVSMDTLDKLCEYFNCPIEEIVEYVPKEKE